MEAGRGERRSKEWEDVEMLKEVLKTVSDFIGNLTDNIKSYINARLEALDGARLGAMVGEYYRRLRESGLPEEEAMNLTKRYFEELIATMPKPGDIARLIATGGIEAGAGGGPRAREERGRGGRHAYIEDEYIEELVEDLEDVLEELRETIRDIAREGRGKIPREVAERIAGELRRLAEELESASGGKGERVSGRENRGEA